MPGPDIPNFRFGSDEAVDGSQKMVRSSRPGSAGPLSSVIAHGLQPHRMRRRPFLYGVGALRQEGVTLCLEIIRKDSSILPSHYAVCATPQRSIATSWPSYPRRLEQARFEALSPSRPSVKGAGRAEMKPVLGCRSRRAAGQKAWRYRQ